jgi:hypothetical protein
MNIQALTPEDFLEPPNESGGSWPVGPAALGICGMEVFSKEFQIDRHHHD